MIRKQTWILLAVFALAVAFAVFMEKNPEFLQSDGDLTPSPTSQAMMLEGWQSNEITWIEFQDDQNNVLRILQNPEGKWILDSDNGDAVNVGVVEEIRSQLTAAKTTVFLDPGYDLEVIGLSTPSSTIKIRNESGRESIILIGKTTPTQNGYYVKVDDSAPAVVSKFAIEDIIGKLKRDQLISLETFPTPQP